MKQPRIAIYLTQKEIDLIFNTMNNFKKSLKNIPYTIKHLNKTHKKLMGVTNSILKKLDYETTIIH